ncbi:MAG: YbgA family protein [Thermoanaerobaculales bacterium]
MVGAPLTGATPAWRAWHDPGEEIRVGVSSCLLGQEVRYDGEHRFDPFVAEKLSSWVSWVPVCPEVEIGLGVPRPAIRLQGRPGAPRLLEPASENDLTDRMRRFAQERIEGWQKLGLDGCVLKSRSPSCGPRRVKVLTNEGRVVRRGVGLFAGALAARWPDLPVEEEGRLGDPALRENFVERLLCRHRWRTLLRLGPSSERLAAFHAAHELLLRAHNEAGWRRLGRLVSGSSPWAYGVELQATMRWKATPRRHARVLHRALKRLDGVLDPADKREVEELLEHYRFGRASLAELRGLLRIHAVHHRVPSLVDQLYLDPHPAEIALSEEAFGR